LPWQVVPGMVALVSSRPCRPFAACFAVAWLLVGCPRPSPASEHERAKHDPIPADPTEERATPPQTEPPPADAVGSLLLVVEGETKGIVELDEGGTRWVPGSSEREIVDVFIGPGRVVHVLEGRSLQTIEDGRWRELASFVNEPVRSLALSDEGELWTITDAGVGVRVGDGWERTPLAELGFEPDTDTKLAIDHEQTVWVVGPRRAVYRGGASWVAVDMALLEPQTTFSNPVASPVGRVHVNNGHRLTRIGKHDFDSVLIDPTRQQVYTALSISSDGYAAVATASCDLGRANPQPPTLIWRFSANDYACRELEAIALDARRRIWVASREGLSVVEDDRRVHEYPAGTFAELSGPVRQMLVVGRGPELPPR
jgi:hypothetical protein